MKILFVCRANIGRSQAAMAMYNQIVPCGSDSAGTIVDQPGEMLKYRPGAAHIIEVMKELGIDMSQNTRRQLEPRDMYAYDEIIVMAEPDTVPDWLRDSAKTTIWLIKDPKGQPVENVRNIRDGLMARVEQLAKNRLERS